MRIPAWMLRQTVTVTPYVGRTGEGPAYGAAYALACHVDHGQRQVRSLETGDDVVVVATLLTDPDAAIALKDLVLLDGLSRPVVAIDRLGGPDGGLHHLEVMLGAGG